MTRLKARRHIDASVGGKGGDDPRRREGHNSQSFGPAAVAVMGNQIGHWFAPHVFRDFPDSRLENKYDPMFGFPKGRKVRVMKATQMEMDSALIETRFRDYCADKLLKSRACREENFPFVGKCHDYVHAWEECQYQE